MSDYALHIGVTNNRVTEATILLTIEGLRTFVDGDGWNAWGEKPGTDVNDADTMHIVIAVEAGNFADLDKVVQALASKSLLIPMSGYEDQVGHAAVLTDMDDWSVLVGDEDQVTSWTFELTLVDEDESTAAIQNSALIIGPDDETLETLASRGAERGRTGPTDDCPDHP